MILSSNSRSDKGSNTVSENGSENSFNDGSPKNMPSITPDRPTLMANFLSVLSAPIFSQLPWKQNQQVVVQTWLKSSSSPTPLSSRTTTRTI